LAMVDEPEKQVPKQLQPYLWKKGVSGNPSGRPPGKTLKEFAREYLMSLPDEEKVEYLASLPTDIVWKMAEGNPENKTDLTTKGQAIAGFNFIKNGDDNTDNTPDA
jgi:hypothetical protein